MKNNSKILLVVLLVCTMILGVGCKKTDKSVIGEIPISPDAKKVKVNDDITLVSSEIPFENPFIIESFSNAKSVWCNNVLYVLTEDNISAFSYNDGNFIPDTKVLNNGNLDIKDKEIKNFIVEQTEKKLYIKTFEELYLIEDGKLKEVANSLPRGDFHFLDNKNEGYIVFDNKFYMLHQDNEKWTLDTPIDFEEKLGINVINSTVLYNKENFFVLGDDEKDEHRLFKFDKDFNIVIDYENPENDGLNDMYGGIQDIFINKKEQYFILDFLGNNIMVFDKDGSFITQINILSSFGFGGNQGISGFINIDDEKQFLTITTSVDTNDESENLDFTRDIKIVYIKGL